MIKAICKQCGKEFEYFRSYRHGKNRPYCGRECYNQSRRVYKACPMCGKEFYATRTRQAKYCSWECHVSAFKTGAVRPKNWSELGERTCAVCGKAFHVRPGRKTQWCSEKCYRKQGHAIRTCLTCGKQFETQRAVRRRYCSRECYNKALPPNFKGDLHLSSNGYVYAYAPDHPATHGKEYRRVPEHRLVMEQILGRYLRDGELVHHKNNIKTDNRPENLELWAKNHPNGTQVPQSYVDEISSLNAEISTLRSRIAQLESELASR